MRENISGKNKSQNSGQYLEYHEQQKQLKEFYKPKSKEKPKGISFKLDKGKYIQLQFINPETGKRTAKKCNRDYSHEGVIDALNKAWKVHDALQRFSKSSEFWEWYNTEILEINVIENDLITYREIFKILEDKYYSGYHRNTKRKRSRTCISDVPSSNEVYGKVFNYFINRDKVPTWSEINSVLFDSSNPDTKRGQATKTFKDNYVIFRKICELSHNSESTVKKPAKIDATQTIFKKKQSISLKQFLEWYDTAYAEINCLKRDADINARKSWLWVASMCVLYGLRPTEIAASQNLTEPVTIDDITVYALTDEERNPEATLIIGEFTYFGASSKTGLRPVNPIPNKDLWDKLRIRQSNLPIYTPNPESLAQTKRDGFSRQFTDRMASYNCPVTQKYAFRNLYNQLGEMYGVPLEIRARHMGHSVSVNESTYKQRSNFQTSLDLLNGYSKQPLGYNAAIAELERFNINIELPEVKAILRIIYQLDD